MMTLGDARPETFSLHCSQRVTAAT